MTLDSWTLSHYASVLSVEELKHVLFGDIIRYCHWAVICRRCLNGLHVLFEQASCCQANGQTERKAAYAASWSGWRTTTQFLLSVADELSYSNLVYFTTSIGFSQGLDQQSSWYNPDQALNWWGKRWSVVLNSKAHGQSVSHQIYNKRFSETLLVQRRRCVCSDWFQLIYIMSQLMIAMCRCLQTRAFIIKRDWKTEQMILKPVLK